MITIELQESIIQKIRRTNDDELLNYLNKLLSNEYNQKTYKLLDFDKNILAESEADYLAGRTTPNDLQTILYSRISSVNDDHLLSEIISLLDKYDNSVYRTTPEQKARIFEGRNQIAQGNFYTNEQVEKEIDEWLNKE
jgi:hypothetical protein